MQKRDMLHCLLAEEIGSSLSSASLSLSPSFLPFLVAFVPGVMNDAAIRYQFDTVPSTINRVRCCLLSDFGP